MIKYIQISSKFHVEFQGNKSFVEVKEQGSEAGQQEESLRHLS